MELSLREALKLGHDHIGTEHLLLALLLVDDGVAYRVLVDLGVNADELQEAVIDRLPPGPHPD
jgi:ATP-dependent Clp protease ATP-binding subunit ClpC